MFFRKIKIFIKKFNFPLDISRNLWYIILALWFAGVAQLVEQLICNQQVGGSSPSTSSIYKELVTKVKLNMGVFPSGQRGQTVNLLSSTSVVRIHPLPPKNRLVKTSRFFYPLRKQWHIIKGDLSPLYLISPSGLYIITRSVHQMLSQ